MGYKGGKPLKITGFIWLGEIVEKLVEKHGVEQDEAREVFANRPLFRFVEKEHRPGEKDAPKGIVLPPDPAMQSSGRAKSSLKPPKTRLLVRLELLLG